MTLDEDDIQRLAEALAEQLEARGLVRPASAPLVTAAQLAKRLGVGAEHVRRHAIELGGVRTSDGPKAPWRFDEAKALAAYTCLADRGPKTTEPLQDKGRRRRRRRSTGTSAPLLPVRGQEASP